MCRGDLIDLLSQKGFQVGGLMEVLWGLRGLWGGRVSRGFGFEGELCQLRASRGLPLSPLSHVAS